METYTSTDAKREFGEVIMKAQNEPVRINRNGKIVAVILSASEYELLTNSKEAQLTAAVREGMQDYQVGNVSTSEAVFDRLRKKVED